MHRLLAFPVVVMLLLVAHASAQEFPVPSVVISGGDLPGQVRLAPADADAFRRRINQPPRLDDPPNATGTPYRVESGYWPLAARLEDEEDEEDVATEADYYPGGGYVRVDVDGEDAWMILDLRQRAILDRYIRLTTSDTADLGGEPSTMDVLAAIAGEEDLSLAVGGQPVATERATELLAGLAETNPAPFVEPREPPAGAGEGFWLTVTLLEGRTLRYYYDGATLTESLGTERYDVTAVAPVLESLTPGPLPVIQHEGPPGSLAWWPVAAGGGLLALGLAVWLRFTGGRFIRRGNASSLRIGGGE